MPPYTCFTCSLSLKSNKELIKHISTMHPNLKLYECHTNDGCSSKYRYNSIDSFRRHRTSKHREVHDWVHDEVMDIDPLFDLTDTRQASSLSSVDPQREDIDLADNQQSLQESFQDCMNVDLLLTLSELYGFTDVPRKRVLEIIKIFSRNILQGQAFEFLRNLILENSSEHSATKLIESFSKILDVYPTEYKQHSCKVWAGSQNHRLSKLESGKITKT